jgi:hypothetical protein
MIPSARTCYTILSLLEREREEKERNPAVQARRGGRWLFTPLGEDVE